MKKAVTKNFFDLKLKFFIFWRLDGFFSNCLSLGYVPPTLLVKVDSEVEAYLSRSTSYLRFTG